MLYKILRSWKQIASLILVGAVSACGSSGPDEVVIPTETSSRPTPRATVALNKLPTVEPTVVTISTPIPAQSTSTATATTIDLTSTPDASPTEEATSTEIPTPSVAAASETSETAEGTAVEGDAIAVHYTGTLDDGEVFDTSRDGDPPLEFVLGAGQMIPGFEEAVRGMAVGEIKTVRLSPSEAYDQHDDGLVVELPREGAPEGLKAGESVRVGNGRMVTIVEITDETIVIDANHPLAGQALTFEIEVISIN